MSKNQKNVAISFRCENELASEFKRVVEQQGYSQALILRELMRDYLKKNKQPDLLK